MPGIAGRRRFAGILGVFPLAVFVTMTSCGEATAPTSPIANYTLSTVDAKALPATVYADTGYSLVVTAGTITLADDLKYTWSMTSKETVDGNVSTYIDHDSGIWKQATTGGGITLTSTFGDTLTATWSGKTLTIKQSDGVFVYSTTP